MRDQPMTVPAPRFVSLHEPEAPALAAEAAAGLLAQPAAVAPKFFYDDLGARLFGAITALDEYYPTRTEAAIFQAHAEAISKQALEVVGAGCTLVDLGAGDGAKAAAWFERLRPARYVAVDIATSHLRESLVLLQQRFPGIEMVGVGEDFSARLALPAGIVSGKALVFYPGSSIGNFAPEQALRLLRQARAASAGGALLIGVDLVKDRAVLEAAYDDALGVTAAFNLNLLRHLNRLLGADFDPAQWQHVALYDGQASRIEMHLQARQALCVRWRGGERRFAAGERLHTENSYKWRPDDFRALLRDAGFTPLGGWTDERAWFGVFLAAA
jgi:L-histidine Nalpha-methyltransferase